MKSELQKTLNALGSFIRKGGKQTESDSQAIKVLAGQASEQLGGVFSKQCTGQTKEQ